MPKFWKSRKERNYGTICTNYKRYGDCFKEIILPIISGNVSFYNETNNKSIPPTPQIGSVGVINDYRKVISQSSFSNDDNLYIIGETRGHLSSSAYERTIFDFNKTKNFSIPPKTNLDDEIRVSKVIRNLIQKSLITACHDISDGGLLIAIIEMCLSKNTGFNFFSLPKSHKYFLEKINQDI